MLIINSQSNRLQEIIEIAINKQTERFNNKLNKHRGEIILENGLTSNSVFQFFINKISYQSNEGAEKMKLIVENKGKSDSISLNIDEEGIYKKNKL